VLKKLEQIYQTKYKSFLVFSIILLVLSVGIIGFKLATTGEIVKKGVSLKGGLTLTLPAQATTDVPGLSAHLGTTFADADISARGLTKQGTLTSVIVESSENEEEAIIQAVRDFGMEFDDDAYTAEFIGSSLGQSFFKQTIIAIAIAFLLMGGVVFLTFRKIVPSLFVMLAAFSDIVSTIAVIALFDVRLSTAGIAAFLMLIGYSVDTDILLTTRVLKSKEGTVFERVMSAFSTGMIMSATSIAALVVAYFFTQSDIIKQIMLILLIGLIFDVIYTWCQNASILRWSLEK
jgi:preprotein translocase subunit SecF